MKEGSVAKGGGQDLDAPILATITKPASCRFARNRLRPRDMSVDATPGDVAHRIDDDHNEQRDYRIRKCDELAITREFRQTDIK